jgi:16S rRNA (uracil1498-N3)-methyltransferase
MPIHDLTSQRLFVEGDLLSGRRLDATDAQFNYLVRVMRLRDGDNVRVFNGRDGEWLASLANIGKRNCCLAVEHQTRPQNNGPDLQYLFAPLKRGRLDYMVQKAVELGVSRLVPVLTQHTIAERVNIDRMRANVIEAAEQCGILTVAEVAEPVKLARVFDTWDPDRCLIFCDEAAPIADPIAVLAPLRGRTAAVLVGPEAFLRGLPFAFPISLGPRVMRADTAAIAALTLVNATIGDWRN